VFAEEYVELLLLEASIAASHPYSASSPALTERAEHQVLPRLTEMYVDDAVQDEVEREVELLRTLWSKDEDKEVKDKEDEDEIKDKDKDKEDKVKDKDLRFKDKDVDDAVKDEVEREVHRLENISGDYGRVEQLHRLPSYDVIVEL